MNQRATCMRDEHREQKPNAQQKSDKFARCVNWVKPPVGLEMYADNLSLLRDQVTWLATDCCKTKHKEVGLKIKRRYGMFQPR